ncbi:MAG TPA: GTPase ObgE [Candidatus Limnocylindrales bacterium]|nr:GTPase ObgE [Candidatus Limnocylindrales bacterium]
MLVDNVTITIKAGDGGNGASTFLRDGHHVRGGPNGGNGGNGGHIYFLGTSNIHDLKLFRFKKKLTAESGIPGKSKNLFGKNAEHMTILVPVGTKITDVDTDKVFEITDTVTPVLLAKGGRGGRGNTEFKTSINQAPTYAESGAPGQKKILFLELRLIAEIGLIGLPNAGKSSLLAVLTNATPKIADYPFTTLEPNIGMMGGRPIADIPGLIEGASTGKGLGITFLKHIEKTKLIIHCIELPEENLKERYETVREEFKKFNPLLLEKPEIVLLTKTDLVDEKTLKKSIKIFDKMGKKVLSYSFVDDESLEKLKKEVETFLANN